MEASINDNNRHKQLGDQFKGIDFEKLISLVQKSVFWVLVIFAITNVAAYLVIRWSKPLYESESQLKIDVKSDASEMGIGGLADNQNLNIISGEIELLRSRMFFNKVIDSFNLDISYYTVGNILYDERYGNSPFAVTYHLQDYRWLDRKLYVDILNEQQFGLSLKEDDKAAKVYRFGEKIDLGGMELSIRLSENYDLQEDYQYFFIINSREALLNYLSNNLVVEPLNLKANTIKIAFKDHNRYKARDLVNVIDTLYLAFSAEEKNLENKQKIDWLDTELKQIEVQLQTFEDYFEDFTIKNRTNDLNKDLSNTIEQINLVDSQRFELSKKISKLNELTEQLATNNHTLINVRPNRYPRDIASAVDELNEAVRARDRLGLSYNETTFALTKKDKEIEILKGSLLEELSELRSAWGERLTELNDQKAELEKSFVEIPGKNTEFNKNQRFYKLYEEFYLSLMQTKAQFEIAEAGTTTDLKILSTASLPGIPISPNKTIIHGIGLVAGLMLGLLFIGIRYLFHNTISNLNELERLTDKPILGSVPKTSEKMQVTKLIINKNPKSSVSEALRSIRTNIEFMINGKEKKVVSITSTVGGEGKTFVAVNLGAVIALSKKKVILLDLDMRKPRAHLSFDDEVAQRGISTILINKHSVADCIQKTPVNNFDYIPAGPSPPNPSELLLNPEFEQLLDGLKKEYDLILMDTPPVGLVTDGLLAMDKADLAIYVVRANYTKKSFLKTLNRLIQLKKFHQLALILNALPKTSNSRYGYGYYEDERSDIFGKLSNMVKNRNVPLPEKA